MLLYHELLMWPKKQSNSRSEGQTTSKQELTIIMANNKWKMLHVLQDQRWWALCSIQQQIVSNNGKCDGEPLVHTVKVQTSAGGNKQLQTAVSHLWTSKSAIYMNWDGMFSFIYLFYSTSSFLKRWYFYADDISYSLLHLSNPFFLFLQEVHNLIKINILVS